jgi:hypothetical protein
MKREEYLQTIKECILEVLQEYNSIYAVDTDNDGNSDFVGRLSKKDASALGSTKAKRITTEENKEDMKPENPEENPEEKSDVQESVKGIMEALNSAIQEVEALESFLNETQNKNMSKIMAKLAEHLNSANELIAQAKTVKEGYIQQEAKKYTEFKDKVQDAMKKHMEDEGVIMKTIQKYDPYVAAAYKKGIPYRQIAEKIKWHKLNR